MLDWISPIGRHTGESRAPGELPGRCGRGQETVELTPWDERPERLEWTLELRCFPSALLRLDRGFRESRQRGLRVDAPGVYVGLKRVRSCVAFVGTSSETWLSICSAIFLRMGRIPVDLTTLGHRRSGGLGRHTGVPPEAQHRGWRCRDPEGDSWWRSARDVLHAHLRIW